MGNAQSLGKKIDKGIAFYKKVKKIADEQQQQQQQQDHSNNNNNQHHSPSHSNSNQHHYTPSHDTNDNPEYSRLRSLAHEEAEKRNECYEQSQEAYRNGDGALAKELSNKGHSHDNKMKQYNQQAADLIYREKNQGRPPNEIDLHGLFVQEATDRVDEAIKLCKREHYENLTIIVGKGLHSPGQIAKLKPAITEMVQRYEVLCEPNRPNPGCLYITFGQGTGDLSWLDKITDKIQQQNTCTIM
ncbi:hypothetical protein BJ944DRAFT_171584 [Cunninghamella echinulata]|nr:hypothetical protein BJ944DRAFT_171584 [Cunninghamella echinulata]